jgi:hypothetical protein
VCARDAGTPRQANQLSPTTSAGITRPVDAPPSNPSVQTCVAQTATGSAAQAHRATAASDAFSGRSGAQGPARAALDPVRVVDAAFATILATYIDGLSAQARAAARPDAAPGTAARRPPEPP